MYSWTTTTIEPQNINIINNHEMIIIIINITVSMAAPDHNSFHAKALPCN